MTPEDLILFTCARQQFWPVHSETVRTICRQPIRWERVLECARENGVAPLVYSNLLKLQPALLPREVATQFNQTLWENIFVKEKMAQVLGQVVARFPDEDLLLVKGAALERSVYEQPWYVWSFDMDLVFRRRRDQFQGQEYAEVVTFFEKLNRSIRPFDQNIEYECFVHHDLWLNGILPVNFERVWCNVTPLGLGEDGVVYLPSPEDSLLFACVNACRKRYFYLKGLCDIAEIITRYPALDWDTFALNAREYRCNLIAFTALRLTQRTLGLNVPAATLGQLGIGTPRRRLIEFLIGLLLKRGSLTTLYHERGVEIFGRRLGWSLFLTYATYRLDQLLPKVQEIRVGQSRKRLQPLH